MAANKGWERSVQRAGEIQSAFTDAECAVAYRAHRIAHAAARPFKGNDGAYEAAYARALAAAKEQD